MSTWGDLWGSGRDAVGALWARINRDVPRIGAIGDIIELRFTELEATAQAIEGSFDLGTTLGTGLDTWGAILGQQRLGLLDPAYRRLLQAQRSIVLSSAGTRASLIAVFEAWTGASVDSISNAGRTARLAGPVPDALAPRLLALLQRVKPGGRRVVVYDQQPGDLLCGSVLAPIDASIVGTLGSSLSPVAGAAPLARMIS